MGRTKAVLTAGATLLSIGALAIASPAQGAPVTIGSNLGRAPTNSCSATCTAANVGLPTAQSAPGGLTSPVDGLITSWKVRAGSPGVASLRVLSPGLGLSYTGGAASSPVSINGTSAPMPVRLPVKKGDVVGLDAPINAFILVANPSASLLSWVPPLTPGATADGTPGPGYEVAVQATIQPRPVASLTAPKAKQKLKKAAVTVSSTETGNVTLTATVKGVKGSLTDSKALGGGKSAFVDLDFRGKLKKRIVAAVDERGPRKVHVTAVVSDTFGQVSTATTGFKVK
jgi:hypothetical protein